MTNANAARPVTPTTGTPAAWNDGPAALRALGATITDGVTRATTHLVVADAEGDNQTTKRKALAKWAAKGRPCREVTETEFVGLLAGGV